MAEILSLSGVRKAYNVGTPVETEILHGVDLVLGEGEFVALIGPSGSGKSTLLNLIGLLERPTSGTLKVRGADIATLDEAGLTALRGRSIGFVFQFHHLIPAFSAVENVMMPLIIEQGRERAEGRARAMSLLDAVGLREAADKRPAQLSGGMQQRVAIARALSMNPPLLLADEPTGNLDGATGQAVMDLLFDLRAKHGTTLMLITHDPALAARCGRTIRIGDGKIVT